MPERSASPIALFTTAFGHLRRHSALTFGIAALAALLSALGPLLQIRLGLPGDPITELALRGVCVLPLELYFVPRLMAQLDAEALNHSENPEAQWQERFEDRWLKAFGARILLYLLCGIGLAMFVVPGVVVLALFGWAPLRVLLRGESLLQALRGSLALMVKTWPQVLRGASAILASYLLLLIAIGWGLQHLLPDPTPWQRLTHPLIWGVQTFSGLMELFLSTCFLALYHAVETSDQSSSR